MKISKLKTVGMFAMASALFILPHTAKASYKEVLQHGSVYSESRYGNGNAIAPIRLVQDGRFKYWQVQLPGGFWDRCKSDCSETYRTNLLDFWETIDEDSGENVIRR